MTSRTSAACALVLTLSALPARSAERSFSSWDEFYQKYIGSNAQRVMTDVPPDWRDGEQVSRDFEIGRQKVRVFNLPRPMVYLNDKPVQTVLEWPKPLTDAVDLKGATAFTYPGTELLACVQANFQGLGLSGSFQNVFQLNLLFRAPKARNKVHLVRVSGYGFDCRGVQQDKDGWQLAQLVAGPGDNEKGLKRWRLTAKGLTLIEETVVIRAEADTILITEPSDSKTH